MSRNLKRGLFVLLGIVAIGAIAWAGFFAFFLWSLHHRGSTPIDDLDTSRERASSFSEFPIYWLGDEYAGLPLAQVAIDDLGGSEGIDRVIVSYGQCDFPPVEGGCSPPIVIAIEPSCKERPEAGAAFLNERSRWTFEVLVEMYLHTGSVQEALADLVLANPDHYPDASLQDSARPYEEVRARCEAGSLP